MRRVAMTLVAGVLLTTLPPVTPAARADSGFWRSAGLPGVDAFGVYRRRPAKVTLSFFLRGPEKAGRDPAVRLTFTGRHRAAVRVVALRHGGPRRRWHTVVSANTGHLYAQECVGRWRKKRFRIGKCGGWRRRY
ncbi:hypothetical protein [Actinoallomurus sp. CA-142502]|uniref:Secreted protein n=2 Tax=Actinoallomurus iriomotensis TaxID=478107 RepID=A0A9W6VS71_9ACTN|nr:hypothetical protein Airi01_054790 [Actinoallomurus iriomotensis]